jgi:peroxin-3
MWDALTHARNRICGFARRHKKMVVFTGVTALCGAGAYYAYRKMLNETEKFGLQLQKQMAEHQILQYSMLKTQEESHAAVKRFIPSLKKRLYKILDLEQIVTSLKELDKNEKKKRNELWEEAKIIGKLLKKYTYYTHTVYFSSHKTMTLGITRYLTGTYAIALLHLLVFAQLSIMGRRSFEESAKKKHLQQLQGHSHNNNSTDSRPFLSGSNTAENSSGGEMDNHNEMKEKKEIINAAQHEFLASGIEYFLENGLEKLCIHVQKAVKKHETFMR